MKLKVCKHCGKVVEVIEERESEAGNVIVKQRCPKCGKVDIVTNSYIHYGDDSLNK